MNNRKKIHRIIYIFIFTLVLSFAPLSVAAAAGDTDIVSDTDTYGNGEYAITKYHIDMDVNENNTFNMSEYITAYFNVGKHGIYRTLPLKNQVVRLDGTSHTNRARVTDIEVNDNFDTYRENGNTVIKIGSADSILTGEKSYVINYQYNIGKDPSKDYDELYYNLIGPEWDTTISNFTFTITMPKETDMSKLGFSLGMIGSIDSTDINYTVDGNVITGSCNRVVSPGEALTVRMELPEGYFVGAGGGNGEKFVFLLFVIPALFAAISLLLWKIYGKDDHVVDTVEFYPPEGFNSLELGFLYKGKAEDEDVVSLLIYLANKGYIQISEVDMNMLFTKKKIFKITKLKEYDGNNINEGIFLNGLFSGKLSTPYTGLPEVTTIELYNCFYSTVNMILRNINSKTNKNIINEKSASGKAKYIFLMIIASFCLITIPPVYLYRESILLIFAILFPIIGFGIMFIMMFARKQTVYINGEPSRSSVMPKIMGIIFGISFGVFPTAFIVFPVLLEDKIYLYAYIIGILCILAMIICLKYLPKRTPYGNQVLGRIRGFKRFLETAEKQRLEALVMQDPEYFYNILPYAYVLGVSDKWINKFETIVFHAPRWYYGSSAFSTSSFGTFTDSLMSTATTAMSSSPSSGGSGGSGGGSSGGGSGGGGGGSW